MSKMSPMRFGVSGGIRQNGMGTCQYKEAARSYAAREFQIHLTY